MLGLALLPTARPQDLDKENAGLADRIGKALVAKGKKKVAVTDFVDLQGRPTELGRFLAEQLSVELVNAPGISVMDRANLKSILAEHKLSEEGLINPETAKQLGQFAGVDVILIGTVTSLDANVAVTVKAISTDTAEIAAAGKTTFPRTKEIQQLLVHGVTGNASVASSSDVAVEAATIATKDLGDLRVTLKDIRRAKIIDSRGRPADGVRCVFEFANTNLKDPIFFAANGELNDSTSIRSQLIDFSGNILKASELHGFSAVSVYGYGSSPSAIADAIMHGRRPEASHGIYYTGERIWTGDLTTIPAGESIQGTMVFAPEPRRGGPSAMIGDRVQFEGEFVVGTRSGSSGTFRLHNLVWGNIKVAGGDR